MRTFENIAYAVEDGVITVTFNRPEVFNAMNAESVREWGQIVDDIEADPAIRVVILTGAGPKSFVAGADIARMEHFTAIEGREFMLAGQKVLIKVEHSAKPYIAAINGYALGGGLEIAMACDLRYAADSATMGQPEILLGITPGWGGTQRLTRLVGKGLAKEMVFTGERISAQRAYAIGLVNGVHPRETLLEETRKLARKLAELPRGAMALAKQAIELGYDMNNTDANVFETTMCGLCFGQDEQREWMRKFLKK
ncbi:MAG: enoyl-CoA hydratase-related protein [Holophaga sp.]|nr:enoyl-CoA hydratase-related protein [Holophaga sp.]